jgi:hypothetical protein
LRIALQFICFHLLRRMSPLPDSFFEVAIPKDISVERAPDVFRMPSLASYTLDIMIVVVSSAERASNRAGRGHDRRAEQIMRAKVGR